MPRGFSIYGKASALIERAGKHAVILFLIVILALIGIASTSLRAASLGGALGAGNGSSSSVEDSVRACTSKGTLFEKEWNLDKLAGIFKGRISAVVEERMKVLKTPSKWVCPKSLTDPGDPDMPYLQDLASALPGWSYNYYQGTSSSLSLSKNPIRITFNAFTSITAEFEREYECRLSELKQNANEAIARNADIDLSNGTQFCCDDREACVKVETDTTCSGQQTDDPICGHDCPVILKDEEFQTRIAPYQDRTDQEVIRARAAMERVMEVIRSFELSYSYSRDLMCYARASLDLRNELNLLSQATSCMPKIWDALTSLHDRNK